MLNKLLTKLQQKYSKNPLFQKDGFLAPADEKNMPKKIKLPLFRLMFSPFNQILDNGKIFFGLVLPTSLIICLASTLLGFNYLCAYSPAPNSELFCSNSLLGYLLHSLIKMLVWGYLGIKWYDYVFAGAEFNKKTLFSVDKRCLKFAGLLLLFLVLNMLPLLSWWVLYVRVPNPDWRIEMAFFAFVSIGFIMPIVLLRFYSVLGLAMRGKKVPSISALWKKTSGNTIKIFLSFLLILTLGMFIFGNLYTNFRGLVGQISLYNMFMSEYIYDVFASFIYISILNNLNLQYEIFYASEQENDNA